MLVGRNDKVDCNTVTRLKEEISVTQQVLELLSEKKKFMHGEGVDDVSSHPDFASAKPNRLMA